MRSNTSQTTLLLPCSFSFFSSFASILKESNGRNSDLPLYNVNFPVQVLAFDGVRMMHEDKHKKKNVTDVG